MDIDVLLSKLNTNKYAEILISLLKKNWKDGYQWGWSEAGGAGPGAGPKGVDEWTLRALEDKVIELSDETASRLKGDLRGALLEGIKNREGIADMKKRVAAVFDDLEGWKTERVVRTEISQATHQGRNAAWIVAGVMPWKMWWNPDVRSKRTAEDSKRLHGQIQKVSEPFVDPGTGKQVLTPPNRPQCRCGMRALKELPRSIVFIGGQMYDADHVQREARLHKTISDFNMDIGKAWTDEARKAALEARRKKMRPKEEDAKDGKKKEVEGVKDDKSGQGEGETGLDSARLEEIHKELQHVSEYHIKMKTALNQMFGGDKGIQNGGRKVYGRVKDAHSAYNKMIIKGDKYKNVKDIMDLSGIRVESNSVTDVLNDVREIEKQFQVVEKDDYITKPKGGYRSVHLIVKHGDCYSEIQVRTQNETVWGEYSHDMLYKPHGISPETVEQLKDTIEGYLSQCSEAFHARDTGKTDAKLPKCPEELKRLHTCIEHHWAYKEILGGQNNGTKQG